jgi:hypothetical protein
MKKTAGIPTGKSSSWLGFTGNKDNCTNCKMQPVFIWKQLSRFKRKPVSLIAGKPGFHKEFVEK